MHQFIRNLRLSTSEETFALGELTKWQTYGIQFLHGTTLGMEIVKELKKELRTISKHVLAVAQHNDEAFENIQRALNDTQDAFEKADEKYLSLQNQVETNYEQHKKETLASIKIMKDEIAGIECQSKRSATSISKYRNELEEVQTCVSEIRTEQRRENAEIKSHVSDLDAKLGYCNTEINDVKQSMQDIYDNVSSSKKKLRLLKFICQMIGLGAWRHNSNGQTIITSRREATNAEEEFYVQADDCITLDVLTEKESLHFIITRTGLQINNDENAICLVHELGGLPLALEQAAAHIKALACTYKEYFNKFKEQRLKLLKAIRPPFELSKERQAVQTTWQLNFDYILKQSEHEGLGNTAVTIVEILAYLYAEDIPFCVINTGTPKICDENLSQ
ncbi:uncharacterized protein LOC132726148, partial [Ruditapes philippinarum]|uniref:uncharacterized protein LOC132726148 n=1 Tax=Ruditapes philippinarum TaxID=129788 RepID=UPI00295B1A58